MFENTSYTIIHGKMHSALLGGPYYVKVLAEDEGGARVAAACTGIRTAEACDRRAMDYQQSFGGAPIVTPLLCAYTAD